MYEVVCSPFCVICSMMNSGGTKSNLGITVFTFSSPRLVGLGQKGVHFDDLVWVQETVEGLLVETVLRGEFVQR